LLPDLEIQTQTQPFVKTAYDSTVWEHSWSFMELQAYSTEMTWQVDNMYRHHRMN